jgi:hypothetical protein
MILAILAALLPSYCWLAVIDVFEAKVPFNPYAAVDQPNQVNSSSPLATAMAANSFHLEGRVRKTTTR